MTAVVIAFLFGALVGLLIRPVVDAYVSWKTAQLYRSLDASAVDDTADVRLR